MRFLRPDVGRLLRKWAEPLMMAVALLFGLWLYFRAEAVANAALLVLAVILIAASLALFLLAVRRVRLHTDRHGFGVVEVQERKILYFGPDTGGSISLDDLSGIEIVSSMAAGYVDVSYWQLTDRWGNVLIIPVGAEGSDEMVDSFAALSDVRYDVIIAAMAAGHDAVFTIWKKTG